jgi:hypothetical protein
MLLSSAWVSVMPSAHPGNSNNAPLFTSGSYAAATVNLMGAAMGKAWADFEPLPKNEGLARSLMASAIIEAFECRDRSRQV